MPVRMEGAEMEQINTIYVNMPCAIKAYTVLNNDNTYTIILNSRHNHEQLLESYRHELAHIARDDFFEDRYTADRIEIDSHN